MGIVMKNQVLIAVLALATSAAFADEVTDAVIKCATTNDTRARLGCYDNLARGIVQKNKSHPDREAGTAYKDMDLLDLKADIKSLGGKKVRVAGSLQMMGELAMLRSDPMDMTPVMVNIEKLPREDRKQALKGCLTYCGVQISGRVANGPLGQEVIAENVVWK